MDKNEDKVEKLENDLELDQVPGGYVGGDWNKKSAGIYESLGIKHYRHLLKKDAYYISDTKVPKHLAHTLAHIWKTDGEKEAMNLAEKAKDLVLKLENGTLDGVTEKRLYNFFDGYILGIK